MSSDASNLPPTTSLIAGKYQLLTLIGRGGMGSVWEGRHSSLGTRVAIKFIEAEYANSQDARSRFDNEARAAATIQSKHAIQIYDHGMTDDGRPYIVMELLEGDPLDKRLKTYGRLPLYDTARIIQQVCRALGRAHERGIIHRDLKPENIFLVRHPDDDDDVAKVLDFGIAKMRSTPGAVGVSSSTKTGTLLGTPFFMSPEQARGLRNVDHRSDLWSLGVIAFKCVTGVLPFDGESLGDLLVKICTAPIPVPSQVMHGLPPAFDAWMMRALDREPATRFQTATELSEALAMACGLSVKRSSARTPEPQSPYSGGSGSVRPSPMSRSGPGYSAEYGGIPAATSAPFTASTPRPATHSSKVVSILGAVAVGLALGVGGIFFFVARTKPHATNGLVSSQVSSTQTGTNATGGPASTGTGSPGPGSIAGSLGGAPAGVAGASSPPATADGGTPGLTTANTPSTGGESPGATTAPGAKPPQTAAPLTPLPQVGTRPGTRGGGGSTKPPRPNPPLVNPPLTSPPPPAATKPAKSSDDPGY